SAPAAAASGSAAPKAPPARDARQAVVDAALQRVAAARELPPVGPVKSEVIGRTELLERMKRELKLDLEPPLVQGTTELLFAFGAAGPELDYVGSLLSLLGTQLAGFYDPRDKEMVLLDDLGTDIEQATLWHELVHALQDQHYDLKRLMKWEPGRGDALAAVQSLAEGDAMSGMLEVSLKAAGKTALDLPEGVLSGSMAMLEAMPEIAAVPRLLKRSIIAPYADGLAFVHALRRSGGWAAVDAAWRAPPSTTEQIIHPDKFLVHELPDALSPVAPPPAGPSDAVYRDVLGEQALRLAFEEWVPNSTAAEAASGWGSDAIAVFATGEQRAVALHVRFDDEAHAKRGYEAIARGALRSEAENWAGDRPAPFVPAATAASASKRGEVCQVRPLRGAFAAVRRGRDVGVALGPYRRTGSVTRADGDCSAALRWAHSIATAK
ncbi:MAG TPA: hypothetical protein VFV94_17060, partial [Polyangiaceae bacterium]|nr:hypothetical protein [Polyangiaceae bacterium]